MCARPRLAPNSTIGSMRRLASVKPAEGVQTTHPQANPLSPKRSSHPGCGPVEAHFRHKSIFLASEKRWGLASQRSRQQASGLWKTLRTPHCTAQQRSSTCSSSSQPHTHIQRIRHAFPRVTGGMGIVRQVSILDFVHSFFRANLESTPSLEGVLCIVAFGRANEPRRQRLVAICGQQHTPQPNTDPSIPRDPAPPPRSRAPAPRRPNPCPPDCLRIGQVIGDLLRGWVLENVIPHRPIACARSGVGYAGQPWQHAGCSLSVWCAIVKKKVLGWVGGPSTNKDGGKSRQTFLASAVRQQGHETYPCRCAKPDRLCAPLEGLRTLCPP